MGAAAARACRGLRRGAVRRRPEQGKYLPIMSFLIDTNVLVRLANRTDPDHLLADRAVVELHRRGELLHLTAQNLIEFRNVATRPVAVNGLGLNAVAAETLAAGFEALYALLPDTPAIYTAWKALVGA